ncbi:MAG: rod shape-determining protein MreD [Ignavibacteriae bacterium]|nr:rod shape-determining protein MreD [Ignavibacteriota bacterium]
MTIKFTKYFVILFVLILIQKTLIWLISLSAYNITPDLVLIALVYIAVSEGKIFGSVTGFIAGFTIDLVSGSFLGLTALAYSVTGFAAGGFRTEGDKYLTKLNFLIVIFLGSMISNFIYYLIYFQGLSLNFIEIFSKYILTTSTYTTLVSVIYIIFPRKKVLKEGY